LISFLGILFVIFIFIVKFPYYVKGPCIFTAQVEWSLVQTQPDKLVSKLFRNDQNKLYHFILLQFDRQDFVRFNFDQSIFEGLLIPKGKVIAEVTSSENELLLSGLIGQLKEAQAGLEEIKTGEKVEIQEEARQGLQYAKIQLKAFEPLLKRKKELFEQHLIGEEEYEIAKATYDLYQQNVLLQEARLKALQTGEKKEAVLRIESEISRIENQITVMHQKIELGYIRSPIDGMVTTLSKDSLLCQVTKIDTIIIKIPIRAIQKKYVNVREKVEIFIFETGARIEGKVLKINNRSEIINMQPMYVVTCLVENSDKELLPGMTGYAKIESRKISAFQHLGRAWELYIGSKIL
jgi:hypothetical protein